MATHSVPLSLGPLPEGSQPPTIRVNVIDASRGAHHTDPALASAVQRQPQGFDALARRFAGQLELRSNHQAHIVRSLTNQQKQIVQLPRFLHTQAHLDAEAAALEDPESASQPQSIDAYNEDLARFKHYHKAVLDTLQQPLVPDARATQKMQALQADELNKYQGPPSAADLHPRLAHHDEEVNPTLGGLRPYRNHDPKIDARALRRAMRGIGTDEKTLSHLIGSRTYAQRLHILQSYAVMYLKRDLLKDIRSETSGNYRKLLTALLTDPMIYRAECIYKSMKGVGTDDDALIELLCPLTNEEVRQLKIVYEEKYHRTLEEQIASDTSGHYRQLLLSICKCERKDENEQVNTKAAKDDALALHTAGEARLGTNEQVFIQLFTERSFAHLRHTFTAYAKLDDFDIEKSIKRETSMDFCKALLCIVRSVRNPIDMYANILHEAMSQTLVDHEALIRVLVLRSEIDLYDIAREYAELHQQTLESKIRARTGGALRHLIMELFGDERFDPYISARKLRKAMKGMGVNYSRINQVLAALSTRQRIQVREAYETNYNRSLLQDLRSELSGDHRDLVLALFLRPEELGAAELRRAVKRLGTDDATLVEVLCSRSGWEIKLLKHAYRNMFSADLSTDIQNDTSGDYQDLLMALVLTERDDREKPNSDKARELASRLVLAGEDRVGTDEDEIIDILTRHSFAMLKEVFELYAQMCDYDIERSIKRECSFDFRRALISIIRVVRTPHEYFAGCLHKAMKGVGTKDRTLIRVIVSRSERDLAAVELAYFREYGTSLEQAIESDTSGHYRKLLLLLLDRAREHARTSSAEATHIISS